MDAITTPNNVWLIGLGAISLTTLYLVLAKSSWKAPLDLVGLRGRRVLSANTPPRSVSPEKQSAANPTSPSPYADILPPQRREALKTLKNEAVPCVEADEKKVLRNLLPMSADYRKSPDGKYTPTGFSVKEIKLLGDFPDYAGLSGVPLPQPYHGFNIDKAIPRPYRPFRWAYHQTMCMLFSV